MYLGSMSRSKALGQELREARLPDTDDPLDRDVARRLGQYQNRPPLRTGGLGGSRLIVLRTDSPVVGWMKSGSSSSRGRSTNARRWASGCGTFKSGSSIVSSSSI